MGQARADRAGGFCAVLAGWGGRAGLVRDEVSGWFGLGRLGLFRKGFWAG